LVVVASVVEQEVAGRARKETERKRWYWRRCLHPHGDLPHRRSC
jgi:hypothetical protein